MLPFHPLPILYVLLDVTVVVAAVVRSGWKVTDFCVKFPYEHFPDRQFPKDISTTDSSPNRQFSRRTVPRMKFPGTHVSPTDSSLNNTFYLRNKKVMDMT